MFKIYIFLERRREGKREGDKHQSAVASRAPPTGGLTCKQGRCPDWNQISDPLVHRPAGTQSTESHQPGLLRSDFDGDSFKIR